MWVSNLIRSHSQLLPGCSTSTGSRLCPDTRQHRCLHRNRNFKKKEEDAYKLIFTSCLDVKQLVWPKEPEQNLTLSTVDLRVSFRKGKAVAPFLIYLDLTWQPVHQFTSVGCSSEGPWTRLYCINVTSYWFMKTRKYIWNFSSGIFQEPNLKYLLTT